MPYGYNNVHDLVTKTADGRDLNHLFQEYADLVAEYNRGRNVLINFLSYEVTTPVINIGSFGAGVDFEEASEYGEPKGIRPPSGNIDRGIPFKWYDLSARFTWQYLVEATAQDLDRITNTVLEASNRLYFKRMFVQLFRNTTQAFTLKGTASEGGNGTGSAFTAFPFYNGDSEVPPPVGPTTFAAAHDHFNTNASATLTPPMLEALMTDVTEHGFNRVNGYRLVVLVNEAQANVIRTFRAGVAAATWDFIPATGTNVILAPGTIVLGSQSSNELDGLDRVGTYGDWSIVVNAYMPAGYLFAFATGGANALNNPVAIRVHKNENLRGLRLVKGRNPDYPLIDSFYVNGLGTGVLERGAGAVLQLGNAGAYAPPTEYAA